MKAIGNELCVTLDLPPTIRIFKGKGMKKRNDDLYDRLDDKIRYEVLHPIIAIVRYRIKDLMISNFPLHPLIIEDWTEGFTYA